jgi:hypothetical protein
MELKKKNIVTPDMTFKTHDELNRKDIAINFNNLFENTENPFVVALNSKWGTGKSQFIHMWRNLLEKGDESKTYIPKESIYINLWEEDFLKSPFFSLTNCLFEIFKKNNIGESENLKEWKKVGMELSRALVDRVLNVNIEKLMEEGFEKKQKDDKIKFKEGLKELSQKIKDKTNFPLIVFVDELDRCRPDYAVEFLEVIKHFFDIKNIVFVLGIDMEQLKYSVQSLYGIGMNAEEYLRKFIDMSYEFPEPELENYLEFLFREFECTETRDVFIELSKNIIKRFKPTLRQVDSFFSRFKLIEFSTGLDYVQSVFLLCLKIFDEKKYNKMIEGKISNQEIIEFLKYFEYNEARFWFFPFWRVAHNMILRNSDSISDYKKRVKDFLDRMEIVDADFRSKILHPEEVMMIEFTYNLRDIISNGDTGQVDRGMRHLVAIYNDKESKLRNFESMLTKIDFLIGIDFSGDEDE